MARQGLKITSETATGKSSLSTGSEKFTTGSKNRWFVVADDFTGAADAGVQFSKKHMSTLVLSEKEYIEKALKEYDVLAFDTESRSDTKEEAYRKAFDIGRIAKQLKVKNIYKKVDSTLRGNIGAEIDGLMDSTGIRHAIVVPALPSNGRITKNGSLYVKGIILENTETALDPINPVRESFIPDIIGRQTKKSIEIINHKEIRADKNDLACKIELLIKKGVQIIVIDALSDNDLDRIASAAVAVRQKILYAGSAGLAAYLPGHINRISRTQSNIVIAGSASEVTRKQIDYLRNKLSYKLVEINVARVLTHGPADERNRIIRIVGESVKKKEDVIIRSTRSESSVGKSYKKGKELGIDKPEVSQRVSSFMGEIAGHILREYKINGILLTGGDIAFKTAKFLNITGTVVIDEMQPGISYGHFIDEKYKETVIVLKPGGFGHEDAIYKALEFLSNR